MKYLNEQNIREIGINWKEVIDVIKKTSSLLAQKEYSQPVKPYLRYKNLKNRIIAMPAYIGGENETAGIKWIASFPDNIKQDIPRAHSTIILNEANTGKPYSIINTAIVSGIRTAGVSGMVVDEYLSHLPSAKNKVRVGIIGFGPIGQLHLNMLLGAFSDYIQEILIYDLRGVKSKETLNEKVKVCDTWEEVFDHSTIFITCTVSSERYINRKPATPSLQLNVSLRDYEPEFMDHVNLMLVDNWEEICRENTDIENMHKKYQLNEEHVRTIDEIISHDLFHDISDKVVMVNPMGMAIYDMAVGRYYYDKSNQLQVGTVLED